MVRKAVAGVLISAPTLLAGRGHGIREGACKRKSLPWKPKDVAFPQSASSLSDPAGVVSVESGADSGHRQPQVFGVQPQPAPEEAEPFEELDLFVVWKAESWRVWRSLAHFGQVIVWPLEITTLS